MNKVTVITSKSYVHRLLIAAALCGEKISVVTNIVSDDMKATANALTSLGAHVTIAPFGEGYEIIMGHDDGGFTENGCESSMIDCGESGSTARFIMPLAAYAAGTATLTGSGRLPERPMGPLCDVLRRAGAGVSGDHLPITVSGKLHSGEYEIPGNVSSQYITGLLFTLPLLEGDSRLIIKGGLESAAYVDMTVDVLEKFGVRVIKDDSGYVIPGGQKYRFEDQGGQSGQDTRRIVAEGDWSNAAYLIAPAVLGRSKGIDGLRIGGLNPSSIQGDRAIIGILNGFGVSAEYDSASSEYAIQGSPSMPVDVDCSQIPDLVPALSVMAAYVKGDSVFRNVERLRVKECDRADAIKKLLEAVGVSVYITSRDGHEDLTVCGNGLADPGSDPVLCGFGDHRMVMAAAAIAFALDRPVTITDSKAVNKSYPGFFDITEKMGLKTCHLQ